MKKLFTTLFFCFLFFSGSIHAQTWSQLAPIYNYGRYVPMAVGCDTLGYMGMGQSANGTAPNYLNDFWQYSPTTNQWNQLASFPPGGQYMPSSFAINHLIYVCCGFDNNRIPQNDLWVYNPSNGKWNQLASLPDTGRYACAGFVIGDSVFYIGTGSFNSSTQFISGFYKYSPKTNTWTKVADFGGGPRDCTYSFQINNVGYVGGGGVNDFDYINDLWAYYPDSDKWVQKENLPNEFCNASASFALNGYGYVISGINVNRNYTNQMAVYNPVKDTWSVQTNSPFAPRCLAASFVVGNNGFFGMGMNNIGEFSDLWTFTGPQNDTPVKSARMNSYDFNFFPNPAHESVEVDIPNLANSIATIKIYNNSGKLLIVKSTAQEKNIISMSGLSTGFYIIEVNNKNSVSSKKLIKY